MKQIYLSLLCLLFSAQAFAVTIFNDSLRGGSLPAGWSQTSVTFSTASGGYANFTSTASILTSPVYDLSTYSNIVLTYDVAKFGTGQDGPLTVQVSTDGGSTWTAASFNSPTPNSSTYVSATDTITTTSATTRFRWIRSDSPSQKRLRDLELTGDVTPSGPTIATSAIFGSPFCVGNGVTAAVTVPYTITGTFNGGNTFTATLSNASGSFASGTTNIGSVTTTSAGSISAVIPASVGAGTGYRIRVDGSDPSTTGADNGSNLTVEAFAGPTTVAATCGNTEADVSWANPDCFDQIMVVAKASAFTSALPTGNGSAYTANLAFGSGTVFDGGRVVYKGTGTASGTITGLTNGTTYHFKTFARKGTTWVAGGTDNCAPATGPCFSEGFESGLPTSYSATTSYSLASGTWTGQANGVIRGTAGVNSGSYSLQLRSQTGAQVTSPNLTTGVDVLSFYVRASTSSGAYQVNISTNNGASFSPAPGSPFTISTTTTLRTITINDPSITNIQFYRTGATIYIDDVSWTCPPACTPPADPTGTITGTTPACANTTLSFSGSASSPVVNYWQTTTGGTSTSNNAASTLNATTTGDYYVRAYNTTTTCWSAGEVGPYAVTINNNTNISSQPPNRSVFTGDNTTFTVTATGAASYQWQVDTGSGFGDITNGGVYSGATTATLTITGATIGMDGYEYRVVIGGNAPCTGATSNAGTLTVVTAIAIPDNGCATNSYATLTFNYPTNLNITDVNVGIKASTTWRGDLSIKLTSPDGTEISIVNSVGGSADNLDALIDDAGTANALSSGNHVVDGTYDVTAQTQGSGTSPLSTFNGEESAGIWTLTVCDDASLDLSYLHSFEVFVTGSAVCASTANITSFGPTTGPVGTMVTIVGSGFTGATNVTFNNLSATSFTVIDNNTIVAEVPAGNVNGRIRVFDASNCPFRTNTQFTLVAEEIGTCGSGGATTELIISEIYDATVGDYHFVEIFNGTPSAINLSSYSIRINTGNITDIPLSNVSLASGAVWVVGIGTSSNPCGVTPDQTNNAGGFNGNDQVMLRKSGVTIDYTNNPNSGAGFSQIRKATVTAPTSTYIASEWTISGTESCSNLGASPFAAGPQLTITGQPTDVSGCELSFAVTATSSASIGYQWKYNDGTSAGWTNVTTFTGTTVTGATGATLTITGDVTTLNGYQFYNELTAGTCEKVSNAVQFTVEVLPVFRSKTNGNWNNAATWEMANTTAGPWSDACEYPTHTNTTEVIIKDTVVLVHSDSIDKVTIETAGVLELTGSNKLTVLNSVAGADLIVNGTLYDRCNNSGSAGLDFEDNTGTANDASWVLGANGAIIKTNTSSVTRYRDFYEGGMSAVPATANWYYRYNGDGNPNTAWANMYYPNLHFENTANAGNFSWNTFSMILSGRVTTATVKGDLNIGVTGSGTVSVFNNNINSQPAVVQGDLYVETGSTLSTEADPTLSAANYGVSGGSTGTYGHGTGFEVRGAVYVEGTLDINTASTGLLRFAGSGTQDVLGSGTIDLWNVEKLASGAVTLDRPIVVNNDITLSAGTLDAAGEDITVRGIWNNTGATFTHNNNKVIFDGTGNSTIRSNGQAFYNVDVNTTGSGKIYPVTDDMTVENLLKVLGGAVDVPNARRITTAQFDQDAGGVTTIFSQGELEVD